MTEFRTERDSMGEVQVPAKAYYGAQTQRAVENFPISGWPLCAALIHAAGPGEVRRGIANRDLGKLTGTGKNPLDDKQVEQCSPLPRSRRRESATASFRSTSSRPARGTSSNMNANEVIANRAIEMLGGDRFASDEADPSQRPRQHGAEHQRHVPHGDSRRRRPWRSRTT